MSFAIGNHIVYNPTIENLASPVERPHDLGRIIETDEHYGLIYFPASGFIARILFSALEHLSDAIPLPAGNLEEAMNTYNQRMTDVRGVNNNEHEDIYESVD